MFDLMYGASALKGAVVLLIVLPVIALAIAHIIDKEEKDER